MAEVRASTRARTPTKELFISHNSYAHDEQGVNPGQVRGFDGVLYVAVADALISSVKVSAALT